MYPYPINITAAGELKMIKDWFTGLLLSGTLVFSPAVISDVERTELFNQFVQTMVNKHQFVASDLQQLFQSVEIKDNIIQLMNRPAEGMPWYQYRKIFMIDRRITAGAAFWLAHQDVLDTVEKKYGVPADIIVAIIGVETFYGENTGNHRVIDALSTLAFNYPKRSRFFLSELENFLILSREEKLNPLQPTGSYAGAMGIPQFMPSSYLTYAADYEGDGQRDIWQNPADAIASVANYFSRHHWQPGKPVAALVMTKKIEELKKRLTKGLKPDIQWQQLQALAVTSQQPIQPDTVVKLLAYQQLNNQEWWVGFDNFYVITRYNHSPLYAMAVFQLSQAIRQRYTDIGQEKTDLDTLQSNQ